MTQEPTDKSAAEWHAIGVNLHYSGKYQEAVAALSSPSGMSSSLPLAMTCLAS